MENFQVDRSRAMNVGRMERIISAAGGLVVLLLALSRFRKVNMPLAAGSGYLIYRGISGRDPVYKALGISRAEPDGSSGIEVSRTISVQRTRDDVYAYWRDFENLPAFMEHLISVRVNRETTGREQSHWEAKAPLGQTIEWDAEIVDEQPGRRIAWRSLPGSQVDTYGFVEFEDTPYKGGTIIKVHMVYHPPAGSLGAAAAKILGEEPSLQVQDDLRHLKQYLETGEVTTIEGQSSGRISKVVEERKMTKSTGDRKRSEKEK
jgi:uncharacterized membrane protein